MKSVAAAAEGWEGWDAYAPFYDWENARTMGRRDVPFWRELAEREAGPVLELGCGTGRLVVPLGRAGVRSSASIDPTAMLARRARGAVAAGSAERARRGDIRELPFAAPFRSSWRPTASCSRCCANATSLPRSGRGARAPAGRRVRGRSSPIYRRGRNTRGKPA